MCLVFVSFEAVCGKIKPCREAGTEQFGRVVGDFLGLPRPGYHLPAFKHLLVVRRRLLVFESLRSGGSTTVKRGDRTR